jgi:hypothetical protein
LMTGFRRNRRSWDTPCRIVVDMPVRNKTDESSPRQLQRHTLNFSSLMFPPTNAVG